MMRCKEASTILATSDPPGDWRRRLSMRVHLSICPDCRSFRRQIDAMADLARQAGMAFAQEPPHDFETDLVRRLAAPNRST
jgi:hypothetical protein